MKAAPTFAAALVLAACSSSSKPTTETAQDAGLQNSTASLLHSIAEALCPLYARCDGRFFATEYGSLEECITVVSSAPPVEFRLAGVAPDFGERVLDAVKRASCAPAEAYFKGVDIPLDSFAVPGSLPLGASCWHGHQCASGMCSPVGEDCGRECIDFVWPSCSTDSDCEFEYCSPAGQCGFPPPKELGAACMYHSDCLSTYCDFESNDWVCAVFASDIDLGGSCVGGTCAAGLECSQATQTCVTQSYDPIGSACDPTKSTPTCLGSYCSSLTATCTARAKPGGACTIHGEPECPFDHTCAGTVDGGLSGTCQPTPLVEVCN